MSMLNECDDLTFEPSQSMKALVDLVNRGAISSGPIRTIDLKQMMENQSLQQKYGSMPDFQIAKEILSMEEMASNMRGRSPELAGDLRREAEKLKTMLKDPTVYDKEKRYEDMFLHFGEVSGLIPR